MGRLSFNYFVASRLIRGTKDGRSTTSLLRLTTIGVALSLAVILISVSIILGFKERISAYAYSQTGHLTLYAFGQNWNNTTTPIELQPQLLEYIRQQREIKAIYPIIQQAGLLKSQADFAGIQIYGVDSTFNLRDYEPLLREGTLPKLTNSQGNYEILLPSKLVDRMGYRVGDKIHIYYLGDKIRVRGYTLSGVYEAALETMPALCGIQSLRSLNRWQRDDYSRLMIMLQDPQKDGKDIEHLSELLRRKPEWVGHTNFALNSAWELSPMLFSWLELLDTNIYFLLVLMLLVGGFTMITGIIIVVLDKAKQIGILKAIGATEGQIRQIFVMLSLQLILRGLFWGNLIAGGFCIVQYYLKPIKLSPESYFMDAVPISLDVWSWLGLNLGALVLILLMTIAPTKIISKIHPSESMRID